MDRMEDLEGLDLGFRRTTKDKLNWRLEIQKRMDIAISTYGTERFFKNVERLIKTIVFNIHGYKFKETIEEEVFKLKYRQILKEKWYERFDRNTWEHPIRRKILLMDLTQEYYDDLYDFICQLIAEKGLLLDTEVITPIRMKGPMMDEYGPLKETTGETFDE